MEKKEMVIKILKESGTLTAKQISAFAKRKYDFDITPQGASGVMRGLIGQGLAVSSKDGSNQTRYWLNTCTWKDMTAND